MKVTCKQMDTKLTLDIKNKLVEKIGYAFIDEDGHTIIQTYSESHKKALLKSFKIEAD